MTDQASDIAQARIDRALSRIEAAAQRIPASDGDLRQRHDALRVQVAAALAALDSLIAQEKDD